MTSLRFIPIWSAKPILLLLLGTPGLLLAGCTSASRDMTSGITGIWGVDGTEKVRRDDVDHWSQNDPKNAVWQGNEIHLFGLRNEIVDFQLILAAKGIGADSVTVQFPELRCGQSIIANTRKRTDPFDFVGQEIELFLEHYIDLKQRNEWWLASARPLPDNEHLGWIPDALIPLETGQDGESPRFTIGAGNLQGVWVDITIPRDCPPGDYRGTIVVKEPRRTHHIPVRLQVFDATLPDETHLPNHFHWNDQTIVARHGVADNTDRYWEIFRNYENVFHRHRLNLVDGRRTLDSFTVHLGGYYTGAYYTPPYRFEGPGEKHGNPLYSIGTYDQPDHGWISGFWPDSPAVWQSAADAWEGWFLAHAPGVVRFKYMEDEAPPSHRADIIRKVRWIREGTGVGKNLGTLVTSLFAPELFGGPTIWMVEGQAGWKDGADTKGFDITIARERQRYGERVGLYNGQRPSYGEPTALDNFAADARVNPWICWKYHVDQYFYWETAYYADKHHDIWQAPMAGSLVYAGEDKKYPGEDRHLPGPVMSLRLKNLRRGFQDYEYLWLAHERHINTNDLVSRVVPAAFNDYNGSTFTSQADQPLWARRGYVFERVRQELAILLATGSSPALPR